MNWRALNLTVVLSFVLCLAVTAAIIVQWARSSRGGEMIARNSIRFEPGRTIMTSRRAWSTPGTLDLDWNEVALNTSDIPAAPTENWVHRRYDGDRGQMTRAGGDAPPWLVGIGLNWSGGSAPGAGRSFWIRVRYSLLVAVATAITLVPATALWRISRGGRRRLAGLCTACGYDLRATPDRCPECGVPQAPHNPPMQRTGGDGTLLFVGRPCAGR